MTTSRVEPVILDSNQSNWLDVVRDYVGSLRFGRVEVVVRDQRVVEIEKTERIRLATVGEADAVGAPAPKKNLPAAHKEAAGKWVR